MPYWRCKFRTAATGIVQGVTVSKAIRGPGNPAETLVLVAPLDGWASPLAEVPDPVFADKMMGDGIAIDPIGSLLSAPCDGEVMLLHAARHAITLRAANGAEILMHVGLDTVGLGGEGFTPHVRQGQKVAAGDRLISFDLEKLGQAAKSLITPIVIANGEDFAIEWRLDNKSVVRGQAVMRVRRLVKASAAIGEAREIRRALVITLAHGLHARPAARLADLAKSFSADMALEFGTRRASLRSPVAMMGLGLAKGAAINLIAAGLDAEDAVAAIAALVESGMGEMDATIETIITVAAPSDQPGVVTGVCAAPGLAMGKALRFTRAEIIVAEHGKGAIHESKRLGDAVASVRIRLGEAMRKDRSAILAAHLAFLDDPELAAEAGRQIAQGKSAGYAWRTAIATHVAVLKRLTDTRFAERAADLIDLEHQVLIALGDAQAQAEIALPEDTILLADDLLPSELISLDAARLAGIALARGGPTSHVAILAATMDIPMLVACGEKNLLAIRDGTTLLLDGDQGRLTIDPSSSLMDNAGRRIVSHREGYETARALAHELCHTGDGVRIEVNANLGSRSDAVVAVAAGAEGCGLLRTEFLFLDRESPPGEEEQADVYRAIAKTLEPRPLTIRTLDIGGDKPAPYLPFPAEENPALGLRGVRVSLWRPDLLAVQLRAILRAVPAMQCRIMVPMIASLAELREVRRALDRARAELGITVPVSLGVMVETPAAAMTADLLAAEADFLSIGTNDLTQYCLAMDRGNAGLAPYFDALHPAVLRLIAATTEGASRRGKPVSVCGGLASDLAAAPFLIGLGARGLSAAAAQIPALKARIRNATLAECRHLAEKALAASSAAEVRSLVLGET
ncbi:MAG TPA: phosphoenolpyruvate--protein phosphotransferase [Rhizomicrobium sp.]|nr:phosphoenolpyruvate--protein phosphotransferase [Rhizomicrobium sp.]